MGAGFGACAGGSIQEKVEATVGNCLWNFFGLPHGSVTQEFQAKAFAALKAGFQAAAGISVGGGAGLALNFAAQFATALGVSMFRSSSGSAAMHSVVGNVLQHTSGMQETSIIQNAHQTKNLF